MLGRGVILQVLSLVGGIILARILTPAEFGLFGIVTFVVLVLAQWGEVGLAPSLIQRAGGIETRTLRVAFTLQLMLTAVGIVILWIVTPFVVGFYPVDPDQLAWLIRVLAANLFFQSLRSVSAVVLERSMRYRPLALVDMIENVVYQVVAIVLAWTGFGVWSLVAAVLGRGLAGASLMYAMARWRIGFALDWSLARDLLTYGLPFQAQGLIKKAREWLAPTLVATYIGPAAVGYLGWALRLGTKPAFVMTGNIARVSFSHFSRLQGDDEEQCRLVTRYVQLLSPIYLLWLAVLVVAGDRLVSFVYTDKWLPAIPALIAYAAMTYFSVFSWIATVALNARGEVMLVLKNSAARTALQLGLGVVLVFTFGFVGVAVAAVVATAYLVTPLFRALRSGLLSEVLRSSTWGWAAFAASLPAGWAARLLPGPTLAQILLPIAAATAAFTAVSWWLGPDTLRHQAIRVFSKLFRRGVGGSR